MLQSILRVLPVPRVPTSAVLSTISVLVFSWLLVSDSIQPIAILLLQLYLAF